MKLSKTSSTCQINPKKYYLMCLSINQSHNWIEKETVLRERGKNTRDDDFV